MTPSTKDTSMLTLTITYDSFIPSTGLWVPIASTLRTTQREANQFISLLSESVALTDTLRNVNVQLS